MQNNQLMMKITCKDNKLLVRCPFNERWKRYQTTSRINQYFTAITVDEKMQSELLKHAMFLKNACNKTNAWFSSVHRSLAIEQNGIKQTEYKNVLTIFLVL